MSWWKLFAVKFYFYTWLAPSTDSERYSFLHFAFLTAISYTIRVTTGDQSDAGTQAQAHIVLIGSEAATEKIPLVLIQREGFSPGLTETFSVEAADVGEVKKVELSHSGYGADSGWFVKEVEVDVPTSGKKYFFPCNRWLSQNKEDGKVVRVLSASDGQLVTYKPREFFGELLTRKCNSCSRYWSGIQDSRRVV